jgi:signal transduction histidine kinase
MSNTGIPRDQQPASPLPDAFSVPEEPFGIRAAYWKGGLILFSLFLVSGTVFGLRAGASPVVIGGLYVLPAIFFAYFYRRRGVLVAYVLSMFYLAAVILFRYPSGNDLFGAGISTVLLVAIALMVSYLTHNLILEKRKYKAIFDNTENGVIVLDMADHRILEMNKRFFHSTGMTGPGTEKPVISTFIHDPAIIDSLLGALSFRCSTPAIETSVYRLDGTRWTAVVVARRISAGHAVLTFVDISERKAMDVIVHQLNSDANLYLDILTHDINNINTASLNYGHLLADAEGAARSGFAASLVSSLEKAGEIIRNISALRKMRDGPVHLVPVRLDPIIRKEINGCREVQIRYTGTDATVLADEMLPSVLYNLIGNAVKYRGADPVITIRVEDFGDSVSVAVEDNGKGIPDDLKPHVFERFQRGDTTVSGKGLGLYICKSLIERYKGTLAVEDRVPGDPGRGVRIRFTLHKG